MNTIWLFLPLFIVILISLCAYNFASLVESDNIKFFDKIRVTSYKKLPLSITLIGISMFAMSISYRDVCCLDSADKDVIIIIGVIIGVIGGLMAFFGIRFRETPEQYKKIEDKEQGVLKIGQGSENIPWSPKTVYRFSLACVAFSLPYLLKLYSKSSFDNLDYVFMSTTLLIFLAGIVTLVNWFKKYTNETRKSEVLSNSIIVCIFVFPYSLFISHYAHILKIVGCLLFSKIVQ